jgi:hypothetical protein
MIVYIKYWYLFIILNKSELILNDNYYNMIYSGIIIKFIIW